jgi:hypothetical protein
MKEYGYIEKVLSHISGKQRKEAVKNELFDHLDEKERFFGEIGYDENASSDKTDEAMGDADLVGEQLDSIGKSFFKSNSFLYTFSGVSLLLMIWAYVLISFYDMSGSFSSLGHYFLYSFSSFWSFCSFSIIFILGIINLLFGVKRKNAICLTTGFFITETITVMGPYDYQKLFSSFLNETSYDYIGSFFMNSFLSLTPYNFHSTFQYIFTAVFACFYLVIFIAGLTVILKTKKLKNTKNDLKIKNALITIISALAVICSITSISIAGLVIHNSKTIVDRVSSEYAEMEQDFIDNIESFMTLDENEIDIAINTLIKNTDIPPQHDDFNHNCISWSNGFISISEEFTEYKDEALSEYGIYFYCSVSNPFENSGYEDIYSDSKGDSRSIKTVPLPAEIEFKYSKDNCTLVFDYSFGDEYINKKIEYQYNPDTNEFELQYDLNSDFEDKSNLNEKQVKQLKNALTERFYEDVEFSTAPAEFADKGKYFWIENYGVYKNSICEDVYKIDLSYSAYDILITSGVPDVITFNDGEPVLGATFYVKFSNDKAELIDWYYPHEDDYSSTDELANIAKDYYNDTSLKKLIESDPAKLADNPYNESKDKELVNLQNIIRDNYYNRYQK